MKEKHARESLVETRHILMPNHANQHGIAFGGTIMSWIDIAAAMVAERHSGKHVVTVSIDNITFMNPLLIGHHALLTATLTYVGRTSMEVEVVVRSENPYTGKQADATRAYLSFVALDENRHPTKVPGLVLETDDEREAHARAAERVRLRKELRTRVNSLEGLEN